MVGRLLDNACRLRSPVLGRESPPPYAKTPVTPNRNDVETKRHLLANGASFPRQSDREIPLREIASVIYTREENTIFRLPGFDWR